MVARAPDRFDLQPAASPPIVTKHIDCSAQSFVPRNNSDYARCPTTIERAARIVSIQDSGPGGRALGCPDKRGSRVPVVSVPSHTPDGCQHLTPRLRIQFVASALVISSLCFELSPLACCWPDGNPLHHCRWNRPRVELRGDRAAGGPNRRPHSKQPDIGYRNQSHTARLLLFALLATACCHLATRKPLHTKPERTKTRTANNKRTSGDRICLTEWPWLGWWRKNVRPFCSGGVIRLVSSPIEEPEDQDRSGHG